MERQWSLFWSFFKIGFFTFGGGLAMMPFIEDEFVRRRRWIKADDMTEVVALAQSFPGVIAVNVSIIIGRRLTGARGALSAAVGTVLPALLSIILILVCLARFEENRYVQMFFTGIKAASAALILHTVVKLCRRTIKGRFGIAVAIISLAIVSLNFSAAWSVLLGALAGVWLKSRETPK